MPSSGSFLNAPRASRILLAVFGRPIVSSGHKKTRRLAGLFVGLVEFVTRSFYGTNQVLQELSRGGLRVRAEGRVLLANSPSRQAKLPLALLRLAVSWHCPTDLLHQSLPRIATTRRDDLATSAYRCSSMNTDYPFSRGIINRRAN